MSKEGRIWDMSALSRSRGTCKGLKPERAQHWSDGKEFGVAARDCAKR